MGDEYWKRYRSTVDKQVEKARLTESLSDLPSAGKPLAGAGEPYRENWWLADFLRREKVSSETYLPTSLQLRKERDGLDDMLAPLADEEQVRTVVGALNERITAWLRSPTPPHVALAPVPVDETVDRWRARRATGPGDASRGADSPSPRRDQTGTSPERDRNPSWWRGLLGRR